MQSRQHAEPRDLRVACAHCFGEARPMGSVAFAALPPCLWNAGDTAVLGEENAVRPRGPASSAQGYVWRVVSHYPLPQTLYSKVGKSSKTGPVWDRSRFWR